MIIPLRCEGECESWQLIELQGLLESDGDKDGLELGKLSMKNVRSLLLLNYNNKIALELVRANQRLKLQITY